MPVIPARRPARAGYRRLQLTRGSIALIATAVAIVATGELAGFRVDLYDVAPNNEAARGSELTTDDIVGIRTFIPADTVTVTTDVVYGVQRDGARLTLDVCSPIPPPSASQSDSAATPDSGLDR